MGLLLSPLQPVALAVRLKPSFHFYGRQGNNNENESEIDLKLARKLLFNHLPAQGEITSPVRISKQQQEGALEPATLSGSGPFLRRSNPPTKP